MSKLSENLTNLRKWQGFTQDDIAARLYVTRQAVSKWERDESSPDVYTLIALSELYGTSVDSLLKENISKQDLSPHEGKIENPDMLKAKCHRALAKSMTIWAFCLFAVYALICGILQSSIHNIAPDIWLIWFTLPIVPPIVFGIRFYHEIGMPWILLLFNVPFFSGLLFLILQKFGDIYSAWLPFLLIPIYYAIVSYIIVMHCKKSKNK